MAKNKMDRSMSAVGQTQQVIEQTSASKFAAAQEIAQPKAEKIKSQNGRISPQLSCTILPEDKELLNQLALYVSNKNGKLVNMSVLIRGLINLGNKYKEEISL